MLLVFFFCRFITIWKITLSHFVVSIGILHLLRAKGVVCNLAKDYLEVQLLSNIFSAMGLTRFALGTLVSEIFCLLLACVWLAVQIGSGEADKHRFRGL